jgi:hypothetical protein
MSPATKTDAGIVTPPVVMLMFLPLSPATSVYAAVLLFCGTERKLPLTSECNPETPFTVVVNTNVPVPDSSVTAAAKFALDGVAKNVATPAANPLIPVEIGNPVQFVNVPLEGVPSAPPEVNPEGVCHVAADPEVAVKT